MQANTDLTELLLALNAAGARYLIIGGYAFAFHGRARVTKDADIFVGTDPDNAQRVWEALASFGAPVESLGKNDLASADVFFIMGRPPNQIDIITTIDGVAFEDAWVNRVESSYDGAPTHYISRSDLISNKEAAGRLQDLADVEYLRGDIED